MSNTIEYRSIFAFNNPLRPEKLMEYAGPVGQYVGSQGKKEFAAPYQSVGSFFNEGVTVVTAPIIFSIIALEMALESLAHLLKSLTVDLFESDFKAMKNDFNVFLSFALLTPIMLFIASVSSIVNLCSIFASLCVTIGDGVLGCIRGGLPG